MLRNLLNCYEGFYDWILTAWRARRRHWPFSLSQTRRTERWAVPGLPPSLLVAERVWRTQAVLPTTLMVWLVRSIVTKSEDLSRRASSKAALSWILPLE